MRNPVTSTPPPSLPQVVTRWPRSPRSVTRARHQLRVALVGWGLDDIADVAEIVGSELVTNAVRHAQAAPGREIETRWERLAGGGVRIEVHDGGPLWEPEVGEPGGDAESGRGLALVDALTGGRWGLLPRVGVGKLVWACVGSEEPSGSDLRHSGHSGCQNPASASQ